MTQNYMPYTFFQSIIICVRIYLETVFDYHTIITVELIPLVILLVFVEPSPVKLLDGLEVLGDTLDILAYYICLLLVLVGILHFYLLFENQN